MSRKEQIVDVARHLLEDGGPDAVTMRAIADRLEIRAPSLYKHLANKDEIEIELIARGFTEQADAFSTAVAVAVADTDEPVMAIASAYRTWATRNPHLYELMTSKSLPRNTLPEGLEAAAAAPLVQAVGGDPDRARALWAFAHGMVSLELADRFPPDADLDRAWATGLNAITNATNWSPS